MTEDRSRPRDNQRRRPGPRPAVAVAGEVVELVLEQRVQVDLLLVVAAQRAERLLADDRHHRLMVELCVVEAVEQVDRARPEVARQTPTSPVYFACAQAIKAAISSWRTCTN